jgi:flagellar hook assembly protein FlgD
VEVPRAPRPDRLALGAPRPNPMNGRTAFVLELPESGPVVVEVLDVTGRRVALLDDSRREAGRIHYTWDGRSGGRRSDPGIYLVRATTRSGHVARRIALLR